MKPLSEQKRANVISLILCGLSTRDIASKLKIGHNTVSRIRKNVHPDIKKPRADCSRSLNEYQEHVAICSITSEHADTAVEVQKDLKECQNIDISAQTVQNMLKRNGLKSAIKKKKPFLKSQHKKDR